MQHGDLVYIPQDVLLFDRENIFIDKTEKPTVGVFLKETPSGARFQAGTYTIYALGREATVARRHVYPVEGAYGSR
jgi:hypothetical protein